MNKIKAPIEILVDIIREIKPFLSKIRNFHRSRPIIGVIYLAAVYLLIKRIPYYFFRKDHSLRIFCKKTIENQIILKNIKELNYWPTFYLPSYYMQTIYHELQKPNKACFKRQYMHIKDNNSQISLDWYISPKMTHFNKLLIVFPGLTGGSETLYIRDICEGFDLSEGFQTVIVHNRGISDTPLMSDLPYHSAFTDDIKPILDYLLSLYSSKKIFLLGVSMGANMLTKFLAEDHSFDSKIQCFISVSNPFNMIEIEKKIRGGLIDYGIKNNLVNMVKKHKIFWGNDRYE